MSKKFIVALFVVFLFTSCASFMKEFMWGDRGANPKEYLESYPDIDPHLKELILNNDVCLGMTKGQVKASWGKPDIINRSVGSWGVHEQWCYRRGNYNTQYLYFENGILTSLQD